MKITIGRDGTRTVDPEIRLGQLVAVRGRYTARNENGSLRVEVPVTDGLTLQLEPGDILCGLDMAGQVPAPARQALAGPPTPDRTRQIMAAQDDCMYAMSHNLPLPTTALQHLPPWRALFWAEAAESVQAARGDDAENCLQDGHIDALRMECQNAADEMRYPGKWW